MTGASSRSRSTSTRRRRRTWPRLREHGWTLADPRQVGGRSLALPRVHPRSAAELMIAKNLYVETRSGWFSDRSACYLASGRPVLAQDTGLDGLVPTGEGLVTFTTLEEAVAGAEAIGADYARHSRAAREIAEEHFSADRVLPQAARASGGAMTVVVAGALANKPGSGGEAWVRMSWVRGPRAARPRRLLRRAADPRARDRLAGGRLVSRRHRAVRARRPRALLGPRRVARRSGGRRVARGRRDGRRWSTSAAISPTPRPVRRLPPPGDGRHRPRLHAVLARRRGSPARTSTVMTSISRSAS